MTARSLIIWNRFSPALLLFVAAWLFLGWATIYDELEGMVPRLVAWLTILLTAVDIIASTRTALGHRLASVLSGAEVEEKSTAAGNGERWRRELVAMAWMAGFVTAVALFGFYLVLPPYITLFMVFQGHRTWRSSALSAALTSLIIYLVFEVLWSYSIYSGLLFENL